MASEVSEETEAMIRKIVEKSRLNAQQQLTGLGFQIVGLQTQVDELERQAYSLQDRIDAATEYLGDADEEAEDE